MDTGRAIFMINFERGTAPSLFPCVLLFNDYRLGIRNRLQLSIPPEASGRVSILASG